MQRTKISQHRNAPGEMRVRYPLRHSVDRLGANAAAQESPYRPNWVRLQGFARQNHRQLTEARLRALEDGSTDRGGVTGMGVVYEAQEAAARRIAHRLHDESAQILAAIYLGLADIARDCPDSTAQKIDLLVRQLDEVREQLRGLSHELSPPLLDQLGLTPALQSLAQGVSERSGLEIVVSGRVNGLPRSVGTVLYRVVQEALSNVVRHARATRAEVRLSLKNKKIFCTVNDNGIGFKTLPQHQAAVVGTINGPVSGGLGLASIHERVTALKGRCQIASCRSGGMKLKVEIPL